MAVLGVLQPSGSMTVTMREFWSGNSFEKTLDEIMTIGKARDSSCNTIFLNSYNDSYIYLVRLGHLNDPETLYLANFNQNSIAWNPTDIGGNSTLYNITRDGDALEPAGVSWNPSHTTWEGVSYDTYNEGSSERPLIIYTTANCKNLYINGLLVDRNTSGGAGSGYIGNPLLTNKKMVGYKVPESTDDSTKTESSNSQSATAKANTPKAGNGFARITFMMAKNFFPFKRWYSNVSNTFEPKIECYIEDSNHEKKSYYRKSTTGGISYDGENIKRSAYYRNPEADPSSRYTAELCLIGDNGNLVSMNGDSEISSDEPVGHNLSEYLYYVSDYETNYNYLADIDLPIFFNYTDFKSYIQDLDDPVITSVLYNRFNKPFPKDGSGSTGVVTFKIQNEQTIKALMFTLIATSSSSTTRSFKVAIRTSEQGADVETKTFTYTSPSSSNQMPKYYYWGGLKYSGNIWVVMYNIEDTNVWTPTWLEVFTETIPEPKTYRIENLMKTRDFENDVIDIRVSGSSKTYRDITSEQIDSHKVIIAGSYDSAPTLHDNENNKLYSNKVANNGNTNYTFIPITKTRIKSMLFDLTYTPRGQYSYFTITFYKITGTGNNKALEEIRTVFSTTTSQITLRNTVECNLETVDYIMIQNQGTTNASNVIYEMSNFVLDVI